jgi:tripartite-type tricarboxylate transporter receptor subunit TctC
VPFNAPGTATTNLLSNEIQLRFHFIPVIETQVKAGKVNDLAVVLLVAVNAGTYSVTVLPTMVYFAVPVGEVVQPVNAAVNVSTI